jgi:hypothetical protein
LKNTPQKICFLCELKSPLQNVQAWSFGLSSALMQKDFMDQALCKPKSLRPRPPIQGSKSGRGENAKLGTKLVFATNIVKKTVSVLVI